MDSDFFMVHSHNAAATPRNPTTPAKPAAIAPVGCAAPPFATELLPIAAGAAEETVLPSIVATEVAPIAIALFADAEDILAIEALDPIVVEDVLPVTVDPEAPDAPDALEADALMALPLAPVAAAPAELVTPLIAPAAVASPPNPE